VQSDALASPGFKNKIKQSFWIEAIITIGFSSSLHDFVIIEKIIQFQKYSYIFNLNNLNII
jgi:hypothetical protein